LLGRCLDAVAERREVQPQALAEYFVPGPASSGVVLVERRSSRATLEINLAPFHPCRFTSRDGALRNRQLDAQARATLAARGALPEGGPNASRISAWRVPAQFNGAEAVVVLQLDAAEDTLVLGIRDATLRD
jgi:hypothetical protein